MPPGLNSVLIILGHIQLIEQALWFVPSIQKKKKHKSGRACAVGSRQGVGQVLGLRKAEVILIVKSMWSLNVKLEPGKMNRLSLSRANGNS